MDMTTKNAVEKKIEREMSRGVWGIIVRKTQGNLGVKMKSLHVYMGLWTHCRLYTLLVAQSIVISVVDYSLDFHCANADTHPIRASSGYLSDVYKRHDVKLECKKIDEQKRNYDVTTSKTHKASEINTLSCAIIIVIIIMYISIYLSMFMRWKKKPSI